MAVVFSLRLINLLFTVYSLAIIARSLLPWFRISYYHPVMRFLIFNIFPHLAHLRLTHRYSNIFILPLKFTNTYFIFVYPE